VQKSRLATLALKLQEFGRYALPVAMQLSRAEHPAFPAAAPSRLASSCGNHICHLQSDLRVFSAAAPRRRQSRKMPLISP